jgi:hypothetical protein
MSAFQTGKLNKYAITLEENEAFKALQEEHSQSIQTKCREKKKGKLHLRRVTPKLKRREKRGKWKKRNRKRGGKKSKSKEEQRKGEEDLKEN